MSYINIIHCINIELYWWIPRKVSMVLLFLLMILVSLLFVSSCIVLRKYFYHFSSFLQFYFLYVSPVPSITSSAVVIFDFPTSGFSITFRNTHNSIEVTVFTFIHFYSTWFYFLPPFWFIFVSFSLSLTSLLFLSPLFPSLSPALCTLSLSLFVYFLPQIAFSPNITGRSLTQPRIFIYFTYI